MIINSFRIQKDENDKPYAYLSITFLANEYAGLGALDISMKSSIDFSKELETSTEKLEPYSPATGWDENTSVAGEYLFKVEDDKFAKGLVYFGVRDAEDAISILGTFYTKPLMDELMSCLGDVELSDGSDGACSTNTKFISKYLKYRSIALAMSAKDYPYAEKLYEKFYSDVKPSGKGCRCHG